MRLIDLATLRVAVLMSLAGHGMAAQPPKPLDRATPEQIAEQLAPTPTATRSLRNIVPVPGDINLIVNFEFDSHALQSTSMPLLESLAKAMNSSQLQGMRFRVEGHTDAKGSRKYNVDLSERRARAVVDFLRAQGVSPARLSSLGKGPDDLLNKERPFAAENRRVRIVAVTE